MLLSVLLLLLELLLEELEEELLPPVCLLELWAAASAWA
jgi:hypothetical protein